jgi:Predicted metal-dependent phosphoesterases (PHP family)
MSASSARNPDLHCHSTVSDGTLAPAALAQRAHANGVDLWALTDHDELGGLTEARQSAEALGCVLYWGGNFGIVRRADRAHRSAEFRRFSSGLARRLQQIRAGRDQRARDMAADLEKHLGLSDVYAGALRYAGNRR